MSQIMWIWWSGPLCCAPEHDLPALLAHFSRRQKRFGLRAQQWNQSSMCPNRSALHDSDERVNAKEPDRRFRHLASHETADKSSTRGRTALAGHARQHLNIGSRRCHRASIGHHCVAAPFSARAKQPLQSAPTLHPGVRGAFLCDLPVRHGADSTRSDFSYGA